ncbi:FkbM family methyltransferase [Candidatus Pseudothioglobus singularis]|nr:FkbM family methyltransferase [Candidatus Pseudothioglobus singularis]
MNNNQKYNRKKIHGFEMFLRTDDPGISSLLSKPKWHRKWHREPEFMDVIESEVSEGMTILDLGANIGYVTLYFAKILNGNGSIYAVEPDSNNFITLNKNILANNLGSLVSTFHAAIGGITGTATLFKSEHSNMHSIITDGANNSNTEDVNCFTIDDFIKDKDCPEFIKMDIEGAEVDVIKGMNTFLKMDKKIKILMELHPDKYDSTSFSDQAEKLFKHNFYPKIVISASTSKPKPFLDLGYYPEKEYKTGKWSRGIYKNVNCEDFIKLVSNSDEINVRYPFSMYLKRPWLIFGKVFTTKKIVRAVLFEKKLD